MTRRAAALALGLGMMALACRAGAQERLVPVAAKSGGGGKTGTPLVSSAAIYAPGPVKPAAATMIYAPCPVKTVAAWSEIPPPPIPVPPTPVTTCAPCPPKPCVPCPAPAKICAPAPKKVCAPCPAPVAAKSCDKCRRGCLEQLRDWLTYRPLPVPCECTCWGKGSVCRPPLHTFFAHEKGERCGTAGCAVPCQGQTHVTQCGARATAPAPCADGACRKGQRAGLLQR